MKLRFVSWIGLTLATTWLAAIEASKAPSLVSYPEGYQMWRHLSGIMSHPADRADAPHGLIHHIYANEKAVVGLRTGVFAEGSAFVADWFFLKEKYTGSFDEGARDRTDVMVKAARFEATGGWGYEQFVKDSQIVRNVNGAAPNQCFECHVKVKARDYVFTKLRS